MVGFGSRSDVLVTPGPGHALRYWSLPELRELRTVSVGAGVGSWGMVRGDLVVVFTQVSRDGTQVAQVMDLPDGEPRVVATFPRGESPWAVDTRAGRLEQAHKGTLFLDEIGTMSGALQMKLLRVLQEREFERVGDSHPIRVDVRVIAATNSDLARMVAEGRFREDLYYRLNVIPIRLPPLRDRKEDIPLLVQHFLQRLCRDLTPTRPVMTVSQQAMRRLMAYGWPGNVRQLENALERAVALSGGRAQIEAADLPPEVQEAGEAQVAGAFLLPEEGIDFQAHIEQIERDLIDQALSQSGGNKGHAARLLNLKRTTLVEKLKRLDRAQPN